MTTSSHLRHKQLISPRATRALSLLELVVALMLTTTTILMMLGWLSGFVFLGRLAEAQAAPTGDMSNLTTTLGNDLTGAMTCDPNGLGVPFYTFSSSELGLYEPSQTTPEQIDLVLWQIANGKISRAVIDPTSTPCTFDTTNPTWVTIAAGVGPSLFVPMYQAAIANIPPATTGGSCDGAVGSANAPEHCYFDAVDVEVTLAGTYQSIQAPQTLDRIWSINLSGSNLAPAPGITGP
jgi:hypothetical protein